VDLSIVVPFYNEVENLPALHAALVRALQRLPHRWEILYVDDGSTDGSGQHLRACVKEPQVRILTLRRNFGQSAALAAGFDFAQGRVIVTLDADLQNDPEDIPALLARLEEGYDVVSGWRQRRQDPYFSRVLPSHLANALIGWVTGVRLHDYGCTLKAYRAEVVKEVPLFGEFHRFLPALCAWIGARITEVPVRHHPRRAGRSKYGWERIVKVLLDLLSVKYLLGFAHRPMYWFGGWGTFIGGVGFLILLYLTGVKLLLGQDIGHRPLLLLGVLLFLTGLQLLSVGFLAEAILRAQRMGTPWRPYFVREVWQSQAEP